MQARIDPKYTRQLVSRGMPRDLLRVRPFNTDQHLVTIVSEVEGMKTRRVPKKVQQETLIKIMEKPFAGPYLMAISSSPNDGKAKMLAATIMQQALKAHLSGKFRSTRGKSLPLWHFVNGSFHDRLRDSMEERPSMLILSNITDQSTNVKFEKVRDLLEMFSDIPRIIVTTPLDPLTLVNRRIYLPLNHAFMLATARKTVL